MSTRCDYTAYKRGEVLVVIDENRGNMSVTNDAEAVVADLGEKGLLDGRPILIYRGSEGWYDGIACEHWRSFGGERHKFVEFVSIATKSEEVAVQMAIGLRRQGRL